ncbi:sensor histidine kinase [Bacillus cereus]
MQRLRIKQQLVAGFLIVLLGSLILTVLTAASGWYWLTKNGKVFPANYYEQKIPMIKEYVKDKGILLLNEKERNGLEKIVPKEGIKYQIVNRQGDISYGTYNKKLITNERPISSVINTNIYGEEDDNEVTTYLPLVDRNGDLQGAIGFNYHLTISTASAVDSFFVILFLASPFIYITILSYIISNRMGKRIKKPLVELSEASKRIQEQDLNFHLEYNAKNEIGELVSSFENMRAALATSLSRQWELEEERREYIRAISHDLKTPLTIVQGHTEGLQSGLWKNEDLLHRYLQTIERNTNRMTKLLEEFQIVNELESFSFQLRLNKVHINSFFLKKLEEYECIARKKEIDWDVIFENNEDIQSLVFDQERISQVMDNIVMNAVRFTPVSGKMLLKVCAWHEAIEFHVYDSGPGFQEGDFKKSITTFLSGRSVAFRKQGAFWTRVIYY